MKKIVKKTGLFLGLSASCAMAIEVPDWPLELEGQPGDRLVLLHVSKEHAMFESAFQNVSLTQTGTDWEYPKIEGRFNPRNEYRGYFNPYICYQYNREDNAFVIHSLVKPPLASQSSINSAEDLGRELIGYYYCNEGADEDAPAYNAERLWSGNYLNYITMSRMDLVRYQLYGGKEPDNATVTSLPPQENEENGVVDIGPQSPQVLERAQLPPDGHGWTIGYNLRSARFVVGDASGDINADPDNNPDSVCYPEDPTEEYNINTNPVPPYQECDPENSDRGVFVIKVDDDGNPIESDNLNLAWDFSDYEPISQEEYEDLFFRISTNWRLSHLTPFRDPQGTNSTLFANATMREFNDADAPMDQIQTDPAQLRVDPPEMRKPTLRVLANTPHSTWQWGSVPAPMYEGRCWVANAAAGAEATYDVGACEAGDGFYDFRVRLEVDCAREEKLVTELVAALENTNFGDAVDNLQAAEQALLQAEDKLDHYQGVKETLCGGEQGFESTEVSQTYTQLLAAREELLRQIANDASYTGDTPGNAIATLQEELMRNNLNQVDQMIALTPDIADFSGDFNETAPSEDNGFAQTTYDELVAYRDALDGLGVDGLDSILDPDTDTFDGLKQALLNALNTYRQAVSSLQHPVSDGQIEDIQAMQSAIDAASEELRGWLNQQWAALQPITLDDTEANQALVEAQQTLTQRQNERTQALNERDAAQDTVNTETQDLTAAQDALVAAQGQLTAAQQALDAMQTALEEAQDIRDDKQDALTAAENNLQQLIDDGAPADEIAAAQATRDTAQGEFDTAQANVTQAEGNVTTAEGNVTAAEGGVTTAEGNVLTAEADLAAAQNVLGEKQQALDEAQDAFDTAQEAFDEAQDNLNDLEFPTINDLSIDDYWVAADQAPQQMIAADEKIKPVQLLGPDAVASSTQSAGFGASDFTTGSYTECTYEAGEPTPPSTNTEGTVDGTVEPGSCPVNPDNEAATTQGHVGNIPSPDTIEAYQDPIPTDPDAEFHRQQRAMYRLQQLARLEEIIGEQFEVYEDQLAECNDVVNVLVDDLIDQIEGDNGGNTNLTDAYENALDELELVNEEYRNTAQRDIRFTRACRGNQITGLIQMTPIKYGLMTTSYSNPDQGGVLRVPVKPDSLDNIKDVVNNLRVAAVAGVNQTITDVDSINYNPNCIAPDSALIDDEWNDRSKCYNIADPVGEYVLEGLRYFAGETNFRENAGQEGVTDPGDDTRVKPSDNFYTSKVNDSTANEVNKEYYVDFMGNPVALDVAEELRDGDRWWGSDPFERFGACSEALQLTYNAAGSSFDNDDIFNMDIPSPVNDPFNTWVNETSKGEQFSRDGSDWGNTTLGHINKQPLIGSTGSGDVDLSSETFKNKNKDMHGQYRKGISSGGAYYVADITKFFDGANDGDVHNVFDDEEDGVRGDRLEEIENCQGSSGSTTDGCSDLLRDLYADKQGVRLMAVEAQHTLPRIRIPKTPLEEMDLSQADGEVIDGDGNSIANAKNSSEYRKNTLFKEALADEYIEFIPVAQTLSNDDYNPTNRIVDFELVYEYNTREGFTNDGAPLIIDDNFWRKFSNDRVDEFESFNNVSDATVPRLFYDNLRLLAPGNIDETINEGRPAMEFIITYNEQEIGSNFDSSFVVKYTLKVNADGKLDVTVEPLAANTSAEIKAGYILADADNPDLNLVASSVDMTIASTDPTPEDDTDSADHGYPFVKGDKLPFMRSPLWHAVEAGEPNRVQNYYVLHNITHEGLDYMLDNMDFNVTANVNIENCEEGRSYRQAGTAPTTALTGDFSYLITGWFDYCSWAGDLRVYRIDKYGFIRGVEEDGPETNEPDYVPPPFWSAGEKLTENYYGVGKFASRKVEFFADENDGILTNAVPFTPTNVWGSETDMDDKLLENRVQSVAFSDQNDYVTALVNWLKGDSSNEESNDTPGPFRTRQALTTNGYDDKQANILGDIMGSSIVYVGSPTDIARYGNKPGYMDFYRESMDRRKMVYVGANDGMVHAFDALTGEEVYALVLNTTANKISFIANPGYDCNAQASEDFNLFDYSDENCHKFLVDGKQVAADVYDKNINKWRTILVGTTGRGGRGVYALDITNPGKINSPLSDSQITGMWEINNLSDLSNDNGYENLYYTYGEPTITKLADGTPVVVLANGYDDARGTGASGAQDESQEGGVASLFIIDILTGKKIDEIIVDDRPFNERPADTRADSRPLANGLSTPTVLDYYNDGEIGSDGFADMAYAGDLYGNFYRFELPEYTDDDGEGVKIFTTMDNPEQVRQNITSRPLAKRYTLADSNGLMLFFGTGKYVERSDDLTSNQNAFYAIFDDMESGGVITKDDLLQRRLVDTRCYEQSTEATAPVCTPDDPNTRPIEGEEIFVFADEDPDDGEEGTTDWRQDGKNGWYIELFDKSERIINNGFFAGDSVSFYSITPSYSICVAGGSSYAYVLDWETGLTPFDSTTFIESTDNAVNETGNTGAVRKKISGNIITNFSITRTGSAIQFFGSEFGVTEENVVSEIENIQDSVNDTVNSGCGQGSSGKKCLNSLENPGGVAQYQLTSDAPGGPDEFKSGHLPKANWYPIYRP